MPREKPHYQETLVGIRARAAELYPGQLLFGPTKVAKILGKSRGWVWQHYGSFRDLTVEQIASLICRFPTYKRWKCQAKRWKR